MTKETTDWFEKKQLHFAANEGDIDKVKELIEEGYDVNAFDEDLSLTPLHYDDQIRIFIKYHSLQRRPIVFK